MAGFKSLFGSGKSHHSSSGGNSKSHQTSSGGSGSGSGDKMKQWNRLADGMEKFHSHFRFEFDRLYNIAAGGYEEEGMTLLQYLREGEQLSHHIDMHHRIEESYIFPLLAKKMPQFKDGIRTKGNHVQAHRAIHAGLVKYTDYISQVKANPKTYDPEKLRDIMDSFADTLFDHLKAEEDDLSPDSLREAGFTLNEIRRFPM